MNRRRPRGAPERGPAPQKSQKAWEQYRAAECELHSSLFLGGSAQAQLYNDCMASMATERMGALKVTRKNLADFVRQP